MRAALKKRSDHARASRLLGQGGASSRRKGRSFGRKGRGLISRCWRCPGRGAGGGRRSRADEGSARRLARGMEAAWRQAGRGRGRARASGQAGIGLCAGGGASGGAARPGSGRGRGGGRGAGGGTTCIPLTGSSSSLGARGEYPAGAAQPGQADAGLDSPAGSTGRPEPLAAPAYRAAAALAGWGRRRGASLTVGGAA